MLVGRQWAGVRGSRGADVWHGFVRPVRGRFVRSAALPYV